MVFWGGVAVGIGAILGGIAGAGDDRGFIRGAIAGGNVAGNAIEAGSYLISGKPAMAGRAMIGIDKQTNEEYEAGERQYGGNHLTSGFISGGEFGWEKTEPSEGYVFGGKVTISPIKYDEKGAAAGWVGKDPDATWNSEKGDRSLSNDIMGIIATLGVSAGLQYGGSGLSSGALYFTMGRYAQELLDSNEKQETEFVEAEKRTAYVGNEDVATGDPDRHMDTRLGYDTIRLGSFDPDFGGREVYDVEEADEIEHVDEVE